MQGIQKSQKFWKGNRVVGLTASHLKLLQNNNIQNSIELA